MGPLLRRQSGQQQRSTYVHASWPPSLPCRWPRHGATGTGSAATPPLQGSEAKGDGWTLGHRGSAGVWHMWSMHAAGRLILSHTCGTTPAHNRPAPSTEQPTCIAALGSTLAGEGRPNHLGASPQLGGQRIRPVHELRAHDGRWRGIAGHRSCRQTADHMGCGQTADHISCGLAAAADASQPRQRLVHRAAVGWLASGNCLRSTQSAGHTLAQIITP